MYPPIFPGPIDKYPGLTKSEETHRFWFTPKSSRDEQWDENELTLFEEKGPGRAFLGKLAIKLEPAGKIRVFAMVDAWTQ